MQPMLGCLSVSSAENKDACIELVADGIGSKALTEDEDELIEDEEAVLTEVVLTEAAEEEVEAVLMEVAVEELTEVVLTETVEEELTEAVLTKAAEGELTEAALNTHTHTRIHMHFLQYPAMTNFLEVLC